MPGKNAGLSEGRCRMRTQYRVLPILVVLAAVFNGRALGQGEEVSVKFLRAAVSSIAYDEKIVVTGEYSEADGLLEATGRFLRGKGYSQFSIKDPDSGVTFDAAYCHRDTKAFRDLMKVSGSKRFKFYGSKARGERDEEAIFVTSVTEVEEPVEGVGSGRSRAGSGTYRITMVDKVTSNKTVLVNIQVGKPYSLFGSTLILEEEP